MAIERNELMRYCQPMLRRKTCRFFRFRDAGLITEERYEQLRLANTIGSREPDAHRKFSRQLQRTNGTFRSGIENILADGSNDTRDRYLVLLRKLQEQLIGHSIYAQLQRPATAGMIMDTTDACGVPAYIVISETANGDGGRNINGGRTTLGREECVDSVVIFATQALARLAEMLHMWFSVFTNKEPDMHARLAAQREDSLREYCGIASREFEDRAELPIRTILLTLSNRAILERYRSIMAAVDTPEEFLMRATDMHMRSEMTHEAAHVQERNANGMLSGDIATAELLAYLAQAAFSGGGLAFMLLLSRAREPEKMVPELFADIRRKGLHAMLEKEEYLTEWAGRMLERACREKFGRPTQKVFNPIRLRKVALTQLLSEEHVPLLERAMYNPSLIDTA